MSPRKTKARSSAAPAKTDTSGAAEITVTLFDGTRQPMRSDTEALIRIIDGNQKQLSADFHTGFTFGFRVPFYDNFGDLYTVIAWADGYSQAGFRPVKVTPAVPQTVDLMLLPKNGRYNFRDAMWDRLAQAHPMLRNLLAHGTANDTAARDRYELFMENKPESLAALLNITTAMTGIHLRVGGPLDYFKEPLWDESMAQDRFYAWADRELVDEVKRAASQGLFQPEVGSGFFHKDATCSFKQVQFGEANVQLTFHEGRTRTVDGVDCVVVEPDIDYYKDLAAHALVEVLPNTISGGKTDPRSVYVLRWMAGRHAGVPEFDPPYTIEV